MNRPKKAETHIQKTAPGPPEIIAPATPIQFVVNTNGVTVVEGNAQTVTQDGVITVTVQNSAGYELPKTGGAGTTLYTLGALLLMAGAVMYGCAMRRRREGRGD